MLTDGKNVYIYSMQSLQNLGLAVVTIIIGNIVDSSGYLMLELFMCACLCGKLTFDLWPVL